MVKEAYALLTGLFVLILGTSLVIISIWLGHLGEERDVYLVVTQSAVSGLNVESTVLYRGVQAGKVSDISFDPKDSRNILVKIEVDKGLPITHGTFAKLRIQGLTGLAQIELSDTGKNPEPLATSPDNPALIQLHPSLVDKLSDSGGNILLRAEELIARLDDLLDKGNLEHFRGILANLETATGMLPGVEDKMGHAFAEVNEAAIKVKAAGEEVKDAGVVGQKAFTRLEAVASNLEKISGRIQSLAENTNALAVSSKNAVDTTTKATLPRLDSMLDELRSTATEVRRLSDVLEKDPQALLYGKRPPEPGPGEPGFKEPHR